MHRLVLQQAFARAFSVRPNQLAANLEAATVSAPTAAISRSSVVRHPAHPLRVLCVYDEMCFYALLVSLIGYSLHSF